MYNTVPLISNSFSIIIKTNVDANSSKKKMNEILIKQLKYFPAKIIISHHSSIKLQILISE